jgi:hypothetical protein
MCGCAFLDCTTCQHVTGLTSINQSILTVLLPAGRVRLRFDSGHDNNVFQARMLPHSSGSRLITCAADGQVGGGWFVLFEV